ncbi:hypothetical protein Avbf_06977 [Armadillidium vulgare]|nr:hypothetical protein Avbf_06977 [Armadillidium vulgare]
MQTELQKFGNLAQLSELLNPLWMCFQLLSEHSCGGFQTIRSVLQHATEMLYRWLQVKLFHFSATSQASLSNLDEEEYFNNIEKSLSPVSFTIYFNVV